MFQDRKLWANLAEAMTVGAGEKRMKYNDRLVEVPHEHALDVALGRRAYR